MLLPWSKNATIAIAAHGASIRLANHRPEPIAHLDTPADSSSLISAFQKYHPELKNNHVRFIISNHFMRYLILPWTNSVTARADWLALADQAMREEYGNVASDWILRVNLSKHGEPVIAAGMDSTLYHAIHEFANHFHCKIEAIEPLLMVISSQHKSKNSFVISEPGRVLFCELNNNSIKQFVAASPPKLQTLDHAKQIINRFFLLNNPHKAPVMNYLSSEIAREENERTPFDHKYEQRIRLNKPAITHSCWMMGL